MKKYLIIILYVIKSRYRIKQADLYQLEYLFKTELSDDEQLDKLEMIDSENVHLYFYGRPAKAISFEKKLNQKFFVIDIINKPAIDND